MDRGIEVLDKFFPWDDGHTFVVQLLRGVNGECVALVEGVWIGLESATLGLSSGSSRYGFLWIRPSRSRIMVRF